MCVTKPLKLEKVSKTFFHTRVNLGNGSSNSLMSHRKDETIIWFVSGNPQRAICKKVVQYCFPFAVLVTGRFSCEFHVFQSFLNNGGQPCLIIVQDPWRSQRSSSNTFPSYVEFESSTSEGWVTNRWVHE